MNGTFHSLYTSPDSMKTNFDWQTCQILNKITKTINNIKQHSGKVNPVTKILDDTTISESVNTATNASRSAKAAGHIH